MKVNAKTITILLVFLFTIFVFIRPPVVKIYCSYESRKDSKWLSEQRTNRYLDALGKYNEYDLSNGNPWQRQKDMEILSNNLDKEYWEDEKLLETWYKDCLSKFGE